MRPFIVFRDEREEDGFWGLAFAIGIAENNFQILITVGDKTVAVGLEW